MNYLFTSVKPWNLANGSTWWNGAGKPREYVVWEKLPWPWECTALHQAGSPLSGPHTWHDVWSVKNGGYIYPHPVLKIETHLKQKNLQWKSIDHCWHQFVLSVSLWAYEVGDPRQDFQEKSEWMNESLSGEGSLCTDGWNHSSSFSKYSYKSPG